MKNPKFIVALVFTVLVLILLIQNTQVVSLKFYFWEISMSQIILIPFLLLIGFVGGYAAARFRKKQPGHEEPELKD